MSELGLSIGITTAPRAQETLTATLRQIGKIGADKVVIFAEPFQDIVQYNRITTEFPYDVHPSNGRLGCMKNWDRALSYLVENTDSNHIGVFQDDILIHAGTKDVLRKTLNGHKPEVGFYSLFLAKNHSNIVKDKTKKGWIEAQIGWGWAGACGVIFPRSSAIKLLENKNYQTHVRTRSQQIDAIIGQTMLQMKLPGFWHYPSLITHIGKTSTVGHKHDPRISDAVC